MKKEDKVVSVIYSVIDTCAGLYIIGAIIYLLFSLFIYSLFLMCN